MFSFFKKKEIEEKKEYKEKTMKEKIEEISIIRQLNRYGIKNFRPYCLYSAPNILFETHNEIKNSSIYLSKFTNENYEHVFQEIIFEMLKYVEKLLLCYDIVSCKDESYDFEFKNINKELSELLKKRIEEKLNQMSEIKKEYNAFILNEIDASISPAYTFFDKPAYVFEFELRRKEFNKKLLEINCCLSENNPDSQLFNRITGFIKQKEEDFNFLEKGLKQCTDDSVFQQELLKRQEDIIVSIKNLHKVYVRYVFGVKEETVLIEITKLIE